MRGVLDLLVLAVEVVGLVEELLGLVVQQEALGILHQQVQAKEVMGDQQTIVPQITVPVEAVEPVLLEQTEQTQLAVMVAQEQHRLCLGLP